MQKFYQTLLSLFLVLGLIFSFLPAFAQAEEAEPEVKNVYIFHENDIHGRVVGDPAPGADGKPVKEGIIGYDRVKGIINTFKELYPESVLYLDAGDAIHGTNFATLSKGQSVIRLMNEMGLNAMTLGNHEFNYGKEDLDAAIKEADFPVVSANIVQEADGSQVFESSTILEANGLKIGVFGLSTPETKVKSSPPNTEGYEFLDPAEVAQEQVDALRAAGVDAVVLLCHLGMDEESEFTSYYVLDKVEGIDLVIDGHSHTYLPEGEMHGDTLIASTGSYQENLGLVTLTFTDGKLTDKTAELISFEDAMQYTPDQDIADYIAAIEEENKRYTEVEVGTLLNDLDGEREHVRAGETNMGNLVVDALLWATDADVALSNGGNVRASIPAGKVTMGDLLTVLPFGNMVTVIEVSGQDIMDALAYGTDAYPATAGKFPHVAGMSYELHQDGEAYKVENILVAGEPIDPAASYKLATNDFLAVGGDGYTMFEGKPEIMLQGLMLDLVVDYIQEVLMDEAGNFGYEFTEPRIIVAD